MNLRCSFMWSQIGPTGAGYFICKVFPSFFCTPYFYPLDGGAGLFFLTRISPFGGAFFIIIFGFFGNRGAIFANGFIPTTFVRQLTSVVLARTNHPTQPSTPCHPSLPLSPGVGSPSKPPQVTQEVYLLLKDQYPHVPRLLLQGAITTLRGQRNHPTDPDVGGVFFWLRAIIHLRGGWQEAFGGGGRIT